MKLKIRHSNQASNIPSSYINEQILTEKHWVEIKPKVNPEKSYYFYATDKTTKDSVKTFIKTILTRNAYPRQTLDKNAKNELITDLENIIRRELNISEKDYKYQNLNLDDVDKLIDADKLYDLKALETEAEINFNNNQKPNNVLTLADRDFRSEASNQVLTDEARILDKKNKTETDKVLIHHINKRENMNNIDNLIVVDYNENSSSSNPLELANAVHAILHNLINRGGDIKNQLNNVITYSTKLRFTIPKKNISDVNPNNPEHVNIVEKTVELTIK